MAGQIATTTRSNDAYAWGQHYNIDRLYSVNGLNQILTAGQLGIGYDARGNLTASGTSTYSYNADSRGSRPSGGWARHETMVSGPNGATLAYDPLGRLAQTVGNGVTTRFAYDGINLIAGAEGVPQEQYNASNTMLRRYVHGPGSDQPLHPSLSLRGCACHAVPRTARMLAVRRVGHIRPPLPHGG